MGNCQNGMQRINTKEARLDESRISLHKEDKQESTAIQPNSQAYGYSPQLSRSSNYSLSAKSTSQHTIDSISEIQDGSYIFKKTFRSQLHAKKLKNVPLYQNFNSEVTLEFEDGSTYIGMVEASTLKPYGRGVFKHANGDTYEGSFFKGMANGQGTYKHINGITYVGHMSDDVKNGYGEETYDNGEIYKGYFLNGNKRGRGKYYWTPEVYYDGEIVDNQKFGFGKLIAKDGSSYVGNWKKDKIDGRGKVTSSCGQVYEGSFMNNTMHAQDKLTTPAYTRESTLGSNTFTNSKIEFPGTNCYSQQNYMKEVNHF